jgi:hypothetical protein
MLPEAGQVRAIETKAHITADGQLTVQVPSDIPPGEHQVKIIFEDRMATTESSSSPASEFPVIRVDAWPEDLSLHRETMYDDWGR